MSQRLRRFDRRFFFKKALQKIPWLRFIPCEILEKWPQSKILPLFLCLYRRFADCLVSQSQFSLSVEELPLARKFFVGLRPPCRFRSLAPFFCLDFERVATFSRSMRFFCNALFPTRVDGIAGRGPNVGSVIFLFAGKEVFPLPAPHPFSRKAKYF